jgi:intracellular septation protein A
VGQRGAQCRYWSGLTATDSDPTEGLEQPSAARVLRSLAPNLVINGAFPVLLYQVLKARGIGDVPALVAGSVFPIGYTAWGFARGRRIDVIAAISLFFIIVGATTSLISGSPRFTLVKESFFTGLFGLVYFASLLAPRPLMFYIVQEFATGGDPQRSHVWANLWQYPGFRHTMRVMTAMWGTTFIADALIRAGLTFILPTTVFLVVSPLLFFGLFALTLVVTIAYGKRAQLRGQAQQSEGTA